MNERARPAGVQPANLELEQGILGALMLNNTLMPALSFLRADHFCEEPHRVLFEAIRARAIADQPATAVTLAPDLPPLGGGGLTWTGLLAHIAASAWTANESIVPAAREIVTLAARRRLAALGADLIDGAGLPGQSAADLIAAAETDLTELADEIGQFDIGREASPDAILGDIEARMRSGRHVRGISCGLRAIDDRLAGFAPGEVSIVAGRPGMGKTLLALSLARRAAHIGVGVGFDSLEMTKTAVWHRLLADETASGTTGVSYKAIGRGRLNEGEYRAVQAAAANIKALPLMVLDRGSRLADLAAHVRAARRWLAQKRGADLQLFIVDYLGLVQPGERYAGQRVNEVGEISAALKALAKRESVHVMALHQLSRANEAREDRRPRLSDLRDSGNLEQDADVVMFVYRDAYYIERPGYRNFADDAARLDALAESERRLEVIVAKQRQGEIGSCRLWCQMSTNSVRDE